MPADDALDLARSLLAAGRADEAAARLEALGPRRLSRDADALWLLGAALAMARAPDRAAERFRQGLRLRPDDERLSLALAESLTAAGRAAEALPVLERAAGLNPASALLAWRLAAVLTEAGRPAEARTWAERAVTLDASRAEAWRLLADLRHALGEPEEAFEAITRGVDQAAPDAGAQAVELRAARAMMSNYPASLTRAQIDAAHAQVEPAARGVWGPGSAADAPSSPTSSTSPASPASPASRPLRVMLLTPDAYRHSVAYFLLPLLRAWRQGPSSAGVRPVQATLVHLGPVHDDATALLAAAAHRFVALCPPSGPPGTAGVSAAPAPDWSRDAASLRAAVSAALDPALADAPPDVVIELAGHFERSAAVTLRHRLAPRQYSYLGYPHALGLAGIDGRIVDELTDPPGPAAPAGPGAFEPLIRLPRCFLAYTPVLAPSERLPDAARAPAPGDGPLVFGSFNALTKLSAFTRRLWSRLLREHPDARLMLKDHALATPSGRAHVAALFAREGVDPARLILLPKVRDRDEHLRAYARVDVALDPFPYHGTTTTCEALAMGVPVVTLAGRVALPAQGSHASRVGVSLLSAAGVPELIARDEDEYVALAGELARDELRRQGYRAMLRDRLLASPLGDGRALAHALGQALTEAPTAS